MESVQAVRTIGSLLRREVGWSWPIVLARSIGTSNRVFRRTRWATVAVPAAEARFAKRLSLVVGIYLELSERVGQQRALKATRKGFLALGLVATQRLYDSLHLSERSGMDRFMAFIRQVENSSEARFNSRKYIRVDDTMCHYRINRCLAYDFFSAAETPELMRAVCRLDEVFFPRAFPDLTFSRGGSWDNTIACGKEQCEYILALKSVAHGAEMESAPQHLPTR